MTEVNCICDKCICSEKCTVKNPYCPACSKNQCKNPIDARCGKCNKTIHFRDHNYALCGTKFYHKTFDCIPQEYQEFYLLQ